MVGGYVGVKVFLHYGYMNAVFVDLFIYLFFFIFFFYTIWVYSESPGDLRDNVGIVIYRLC